MVSLHYILIIKVGLYVSGNRFCGNCGVAIQSNAKFCGKCGQPVQKSSVQLSTLSAPKGTSKVSHIIISSMLGVLIVLMGIIGEEIIARGGGFEEILIIPFLILILQITLFYFQTRQKSYYPLIPILASLWVVFKHSLLLIALKAMIDSYPGMESADFIVEITLTIATIFGFAFVIVVNIVSLFLRGKTSPQTAGKKVS